VSLEGTLAGLAAALAFALVAYLTNQVGYLWLVIRRMSST